MDLGIIALLAFASSAQVAVARTILIPEVTIAMVTSAHIDFLVDTNIFKLHDRPRNRRAMFTCCLVLGSFIGAIACLRMGAAFTLYISALGHLIVSIAFLFNREAVALVEESIDLEYWSPSPELFLPTNMPLSKLSLSD